MQAGARRSPETGHDWVGSSIQRLEDHALLTGQGRFVDDLHLPGMLHACFVRSPHAHARIRSIDRQRALALPGVHAVLIWADLPEAARKRVPVLLPNPAIRDPLNYWVLARDEVVYVGDPVAMVLADSRYIAEDAEALVEVDYEVLPAVSHALEALQPGAPRAHLSVQDNLAGKLKMAYGDVAAAFDPAQGAAHVVRETYWQNRGAAHAMEPRSYLARHDPATGELTYWKAGQAPHLDRKNIIELLDWDPEKVRVIHPDVGGGFGGKTIFYSEDGAVCAAAVLTGRPVKWIEDRREHFLTATQERDQWWEIELALDDQARIRGVRLVMTHDNGAYFPWGIITPYIAVTTVPGPYVVPAMDIDLRIVHTNKSPATPVRGAGRPQGVFAMERILDKAAQQLGLDRAELRRRNLVQPEQMPYSVGFIYRDGKPVRYDSGDYPACQASAMAAIDWQGFAQRKAAARAEGRFLGIALANYVEGTGLGPFEGATVRVQQTGRVSIFTGASAQGQGHKTTLAQICADQLGIAISQIDVVLADTAGISMGIGTFASRIVVNAGSSTLLASRVVRGKLLALAAHELGVAVAAAREGTDAGAELSRLEQTLEQILELVDGTVRLRADPQRGIGFAALARIAQAMPGFAFPEGVCAGLEDTQYFSPAQSTYCNGTHAVELEVDPASGGIRILRYVVAHDSGKLINPLLVEGQVQGGVAHGLGNAWLEYMHYDAQSQPLTTTFADYLLPMATDVPRVEMIHLESPSPLNPLGAKGAGEGGTIPAAAVIVSAVEEALRDQVADTLHFTTSPLLPQWIVQRLHTGGRYSTPAR